MGRSQNAKIKGSERGGGKLFPRNAGGKKTKERGGKQNTPSKKPSMGGKRGDFQGGEVNYKTKIKKQIRGAKGEAEVSRTEKVRNSLYTGWSFVRKPKKKRKGER